MSVMYFSSRKRVQSLLYEQFTKAAQRKGGLIDKIMDVVDLVGEVMPSGVLSLDTFKFFHVLDTLNPYNSWRIVQILWDGQMIMDGHTPTPHWLDPPEAA